jgi:polar amino acid transport system ATP-binding protein
MNSPDHIIVVDSLYKHFGDVEAVNDVSLNVDRGRVVVIIGPSGSGKSTLLRCINHLETPTSGDIWIDGELLTSNQKHLNEIRAEIGMVFQLFNLFPHLTALENVTLAQKVVRHRSREEATAIAMQQLERVGIPEKAGVYPSQLSGGQQQRVAIARALVNRPAIIMADEPTGNLDSRTSREVIDLLGRLNEETDITLILVTHDQDVARHAERILVLKDGQVVEDTADIQRALKALHSPDGQQ